MTSVVRERLTVSCDHVFVESIGESDQLRPLLAARDEVAK